MSKVVIIGAGPMGLYLAYKLKRAGLSLSNIVIFDPRAGEYTRPGHINSNIFAMLETEFGKKFWSDDKTGHIKDVERAILQEVQYLGIPIEKKKFVRFNDDPSHKGVIVKDEHDKEELVECDYAFDCTGTQRVLIRNLNESIQPSPFTITPICQDVKVKNHFIAYVLMDSSDLSRINLSGQSLFSPLNYMTADEYVKSMEQLRQFGWHEFGFPRCYGVNFTKGKVCLYLECPDNLPKEQHEAWVQATINANTNSSDIKFKQLGQPKHYHHKPRFNPFSVDPMELGQAGHKAQGYPIVAAVGDAQIEPNYFLAHGIKDGLTRVNKMIKEMIFINGKIAYFDIDEYLDVVRDQLKMHRESIVKHYTERSKYFHDWMIKAASFYSQVSLVSHNAPVLMETLKEIQARLDLHEAMRIVTALHNNNHKISLTLQTPEKLAEHLTNVSRLLGTSLDNLPQTCMAEREKGLGLMQEVALAWKELGTHYVKSGEHSLGIDKYERALLIYSHPLMAGKHPIDELTLMSNIVICLKNINKNTEAMSIAKRAIEKYPDNPNLHTIKYKIMFNLFKTLITERPLSLKEPSELQPWSDFLSLHTDLLNEELNIQRLSLFPPGPSKDLSSDDKLVSSQEKGYGGESSSSSYSRDQFFQSVGDSTKASNVPIAETTPSFV